MVNFNFIKQTNEDCLGACICSLFNYDINKFPTNEINEATGKGEWWRILNEFMETNFGLETHSTSKNLIQWNTYLITVGSTRNSEYPHAVITFNGEVIWDPHESNAGLDEIEYHIYFIKKIENKN